MTFTGQYEPVQAVSEALDELQARTGLDIPIHVDGASGGFLAPFTVPELVWDFRLPRVKSINTSGHKFGLAPLGVGWIVWRDAAELPEDLIFEVNYLGGNMPTFALNFSRPGGQIVAQYYNFLRLGQEGYRKVHLSCHDTSLYLADEIDKLGHFEIINRGSADERHPGGVVEADARASSTRSRSSTSPIACAPAAGRCPRTRCRRTAKTWRSSASSCGRASAATRRRCSWTTTAPRSSTSTGIPSSPR